MAICRVVFMFLAVAMLEFTSASTLAQTQSTTAESPARAGRRVPLPTAAPPGEVHVGIFMYSVQQLDIAKHSFRVAFNIWWRYHGDTFDPIAALQVVNAQSMTVVEEDRRKLPNGDNYVVARVEATIEQLLDTSAFPFDRHRLRVEIESPYEDDYLRYVVDTKDSLLDPEVYSPGWRITDFAMHVESKRYPTDFGLHERTNDRYSRAVIEVSAEHRGWGLVIDYFIGFIACVLICLLGYLVNPRLLQTRTTMIGTAVFAAVGNKYVVNSLTDTSFGSRPVNIVVVTSFLMVLTMLLTSIACERMIEAGHTDRAVRINRNVGVAATLGCIMVTLYVARIAVAG